MRLRILSDLHLEFAPLSIPECEADVIVLAGDIATGIDGLAFAQDKFPDTPVIYIAGNHEYYGHGIPRLTRRLIRGAKGSHIDFLENGSVVVGNVRFLACTLWTDFALRGEEHRALDMDEARSLMIDYRRILHTPVNRTILPRDTLIMHKRSRRWLHRELAKEHDGPTVVVTHHAPSPKSLEGSNRPDHLVGAYASNLEADITRYAPALWIHGHIHHPADYTISSTRIINNARGYPSQNIEGFKADLVVDV